jgi:arylformamidase
MSIIDISRTVEPGMAVWPGDTPFTLESKLRLDQGASVNLTTLHMSAHTGTHADAPAHFAAGGRTMAQVSLAPYWGVAQVVTVEKAAGPLTPADLAAVDLSRAPRLLIHTAASAADPTLFQEEIVFPAPETAALLARYGVILFGSDAPSMDHVTSQQMPGHHALRRHGIAILEGLLLTGVADGLYELVALPLKIRDGDGSPVRAALRPLE